MRFANAESDAAEGLAEVVVELPREVRCGREFVEVGGLLSYSPNVPEMFSRAG